MRATPDPAVPARPRKPVFTRQRVVISLLLAVSLVGIAYAFTLHEETPPVRFTDTAVRAVSPSPGDFELRQTTIFVELQPSYEGVLQLDGREIPEDQLDRIEGLNRISFTPGPGKEFPSLSPGRHCATARFWPLGQTRAEGRDYSWCFSLH